MADLRAAQQRIGVPIAVPQNPPRVQTHRSTPKKNKHIAADRDDLDGLIGELPPKDLLSVSRLTDSFSLQPLKMTTGRSKTRWVRSAFGTT